MTGQRVKARPVVLRSRARTARRRRRSPIVLDLRDLGVNRRGVGRALAEVGTRIFALDPGRCRAVCSEAALPVLQDIDRSLLTVVPPHPQALFEQFTLPFVSARLGAGAIYSLRECGGLWGPPLLLHITEDPEIRWSQEPAGRNGVEGSTLREAARRAYSRVIMDRSLRRARVVTCTRATASDLERSHGIDAARVTVVPLGVDLETFRPKEDPSHNEVPYFFHLATNDPRENTAIVIESFARLVAQRPEPTRLVVAGDVGASASKLQALVRSLGIERLVEFPGRVTDERLADLYSGAVAAVLASMNEGFGLQALEALACGALVVSTPAPAALEVAAGADVEWAQPNVESIALALGAVRGDRNRRAKAAGTNRTVASRFSWDRTAERLFSLLSELADSGLSATDA